MDANHHSKRVRIDSADVPSNSGLERKQSQRKGSQSQGQHERVAGVQKIKSALRQCKRLLAKVPFLSRRGVPERQLIPAPQDKLAADKRVQAERQLAALTDELSRAVISRKERDMSAKYHMVRRRFVLPSVTSTSRPLTNLPPNHITY